MKDQVQARFQSIQLQSCLLSSSAVSKRREGLAQIHDQFSENLVYYLSFLGAVGGDETTDEDKEKAEEEERERQEAIREAEERRKEKHRKMEEEREKMRQEIRDKVSSLHNSAF